MTHEKQTPSPNNNQKIDQLRKRLDTWRRSRKPRERIPVSIWNSAVRIAKQCGLNKTSKSLNLDYYDLKKRLDLANAGQETAPSFIELTPAMSGSAPECSIELESRNGAKMRIQIKGTEMPDLSSLSREFWKIKR